MSDIDSLFGSFRPSPFRAPDRNQVPQQLFGAGDGNIQPVGFIEDGVVGFAAFASTIRPPQLVSGANPALPDADYPVDSFIYNTTSHKLWKNVADVWVEVVNTTDLSGQITSTQITDGAVSTPKLATDSVTADKILANTITAAEIAANTITAGEIAAGAIGADEIAAGAVLVGKMAPTGQSPLIDNGEFELGTLFAGGSVYGWFVTAGCSISTGATGPYRGANILYLDGGGGGYTAQAISHNFPVHPGDVVSVSLVSNAQVGNPTLDAYIQFLDGSLLEVSTPQLFIRSTGGSTTWVESSASETVPAGAQTARVILYNAAGAGTALGVDSVVARTGDEVTNADGNVLINSAGVTITGGKLAVEDADGDVTVADGIVRAAGLAVGGISNLIDNPSFEVGPLNVTNQVPGWFAGTAGSSAILANVGVAHDGKVALYVLTAAGVAWTYALSNRFPARAGESVTASAWVLQNSGTTRSFLYVRAFDSSGNFISDTLVQEVAPSGVWQQLKGPVTLPANTTHAAVYVSGGRDDLLACDMYFDNVSVFRGGTVIDSSGISVYNGEITVSNAGSTVIIDGTSNMFKIDATGTLTQAFPAAGNNSVNTVTLTALGNGYTTPPTCLFYITENNASVAQDRENGSATRYPTNGASVSWTATGLCDVTAGEVRVMLWARSLAVGPGTTAALRYYVLVEAGI